MLQKTNPYILIIQEQLDNIDALLEKGFPLAYAEEKLGHLDLNVFVSECGTYRCLAGWCDTLPELGGKLGFSSRDTHWDMDLDKISITFGTSHFESHRLFGPASCGGLREREEMIRNTVRPRLVKRLERALCA